MVFRNGNGVRWLVIPLSLAGLLVSSQSMALNDADVAELEDECEAVRKEALAPIRAQRTQACIEQQLRSEDHCKSYYTTYGDVSANVLHRAYYYDLPECQAWLDARKALEVSRSRP